MQRLLSRRLLAALLCVTLAGTAVQAEDIETLEERAERLIRDLERELEAVRRERRALEAERKALREPAEAPAVAETDRKVNVLAEELDALKSAIVLPPTEKYESRHGLGPAASKVYQISRGLSIGGYGEGNLSKKVGDTRGSRDRADALRFVLYTGYKFSDRIILNTEIEFEHASTESTVSASDGSVSLEFGYLDFLGWEALNARAGLVLVPMGFINEIHEPVYFHGVNRPEVERAIIPSTWRELGAGLFGRLHDDVEYRAYLHTSLDAMGFSESGIRDGRQNGNEALAESLAGSARVDWTPAMVPGLLVGGSAFVGETGQNGRFDTEKVDALLTLTDVHVQFRRHGLELRGLAAFGTLDDARAISRELGTSIANRFQGHYVEAAYDVMPHLWSLISPDTDPHYLAPFVRYENLDPQEGTPRGIPRDRTKDTEVYTLGVTYRPHPQVVLKLDWRNFELARGERTDDVNAGLGFVF